MMDAKKMIRQIEIRRKAVGIERDKLRAAVSEMEELEECCSRAYEDLTNAIDALSELA